MTKFAFAFVALAACSSNSSTPPMIDAPAGATTVQTVSCAGVTPSATIMTTDTTFAYSPTSATITQGQVVQFTMSTMHDVVPNTGGDPGLTAPFNATTCLKFTSPGTFKFHCMPHGFQGTVTVN